MHRIALRLSGDFVAAICEMVNVPEDASIFGDSTYAVIEMTSPTEMNLKLMSEDEIFEEAANDSELEIISM
jgi:hypothetical protein